jgi:flagellar basal-body rod protein FlgG
MRFSIRDVLWLTVVGGLATALWLERHDFQSVRITGQPLDVAIAGEGFFVLTDPATTASVFTRLGSLSINRESLLVLNVNNTEYLVNPSIGIPSDATGVSISSTGLVAAQRPGGRQLSSVGQLQLAQFNKPKKLEQVASAIYKPTPESGPCCLSQPGQEGFGTVVQGALAKRY